KVIRNYADDPPSMETSGRKVTHGIVSLGDSYFYSIQDMQRAAVSGRPLVARKARAARVGYERGLDGIAAFGAPDDGIENGLLNKPIGTSAGQIRGTAATAADFADATFDGDKVIKQINKACHEMIIDSKETELPNTLLVPTAIYLR